MKRHAIYRVADVVLVPLVPPNLVPGDVPLSHQLGLKPCPKHHGGKQNLHFKIAPPKCHLLVDKWYFVTKIVLTYFEKKLFYWSRKNFRNLSKYCFFFSNSKPNGTVTNNIIFSRQLQDASVSSVKLKTGYGIGNQNQDPISVSVSEPFLFFSFEIKFFFQTLSKQFKLFSCFQLFRGL